MAQIGLFRSAVLNDDGEQVIKAVVVGNDLNEDFEALLMEFLTSDTEHMLTLPVGNTVHWLGR